MKITNIRLTQRRNLGNYEHFEFGAEAIFEEDDTAAEATNKLWNFVDWHSQKHIRDAKAKTYKLALADENTTPDKKAEAEKWLAKYEERRAEVEAM